MKGKILSYLKKKDVYIIFGFEGLPCDEWKDI